MANKRNSIPIHLMETNHPLGLEIFRIELGHNIKKDDEVRFAHRDDYYVFFVQEQGETNNMVDFGDFVLKGAMLGFIKPGQVHQYAGMKDVQGWVLKVNKTIIDARFLALFENNLLMPQTGAINYLEPLTNCLAILHDQAKTSSGHHAVLITHHLLNAFMGMAVVCLSAKVTNAVKKAGRSLKIYQQFRQLVANNFRVDKTPAAYASMLSISPTYLNETVKLQTGFSATYWIQQETMLEAKRLLFHTDLTVKQIAHQTGFEDHAYFSRLFKNVVQQTPLAFRSNYRESSNHHS